jgi:hypothetical protein
MLYIDGIAQGRNLRNRPPQAASANTKIQRSEHVAGFGTETEANNRLNTHFIPPQIGERLNYQAKGQCGRVQQLLGGWDAIQGGAHKSWTANSYKSASIS